MNNHEKYIIESVALNARRKAVEKKIISADATRLSMDDICRIVNSFGGQLIKNDEEKRTFIQKLGDREFVIYYYDETPSLDILHELGHAFFDLKKMNMAEEMGCDGIETRDLRAALFARAFLMPREEFENTVINCSKGGKCDVMQVADIFNVDYFSALLRGEELNIWV